MNKLVIILSLVIINSFALLANKITSQDVSFSKESDVSNIPSFIKFNLGKEPKLENMRQWLISAYELKSDFDFILINSETDQLGFTHYRYNQTYKGKVIDGARLIAHTQNGVIISINGVAFNSNLETVIPSLTEKEAIDKALKYVNANKYMWQDLREEANIKQETQNVSATYFPKGELVYVLKKGKLIKDNLRLAYKFDIYACKPLYRAYVYVDAKTNEIINEQSRIHTADVSGTANTGYSGTKPFTTDSYTGSYRLREAGRGLGIETYNLQTNTSYGGAIDFIDSDNIWNNINPQKDHYATDVHWGTEKTYDFYFSNFSRNSIDNAGYKIKSYVHYDVDYFNAFWDGSVMTYGDGGGSSGANPLVCIDIVGHEITHGLTENTANLNYSGESGGLNESFSDIFGNCVEYYAKPGSFNWLLGNEIGVTFRNMANPNAFGDPDTYHGTMWDPAEEVHNTSGVQNFWFYLLSAGGTGTNDNGDAYSVSGIGITNAQKIAYRNLTVYLTPTSNFLDARFYAIQSAVDLFGPCSPEVAATAKAWYAVGVGGVYTNSVSANFNAITYPYCAVPTTVNFSNYSVNGSTYKWYFGDGGTSTSVNPSHTYSSFGLYSVKLVANGGTCGKDSITKTNFVNINSTNPCPTFIPLSGSITKNACSGTLMDDGGILDYSDNTNSRVTIAPIGATQITLNFTSFDFELNWDTLFVYAGPSITSPLVGAYTGNSLPGGGTLIISSSAVTVRQKTDMAVVRSGFILNWTCNALYTSLSDYNNTEFTIYPNPTNQFLNFKGFELPYSTIEVFDGLGRLVLNIPFSKSIDVSSLQNGIYTVTVKNNNERIITQKISILK